MSKFKFIFSFLSLLLFAQIGALGPQILNITPPQSGGNARLDDSPPITITIAEPSMTATAVKFGDDSVAFSQSGTTITIPANALPKSAPGTVQVQIMYGATANTPNPPWDYFTYNAEWVAYIPRTLGNILYFDASSDQGAISSPTLVQMMAISNDGKYAYCINRAEKDPASLTVIDTVTQTQVAGSPFSFDDLFNQENVASSLTCVAISPDGNKLVASDTQLARFFLIDITNKTAPVGVRYYTFVNFFVPFAIAFTPDVSDSVYVTSIKIGNPGFDPGAVAVVDLTQSESLTNPKYYQDSTIIAPAWISPVPVDVNGAAQQKDMVLNFINGNPLGEALLYNNPLVPGSPQTPSSMGDGNYDALFVNSLFPQLVASPDSKFAYITNTSDESVSMVNVATNSQDDISFVNIPGVDENGDPIGNVTITQVRGLAIAPDGKSGFAVGTTALAVNPEEEVNAASGAGIVTFMTDPTAFDPMFILTSVQNDLRYGAWTPDQSPVARSTFTVSGSNVTFYGDTFGGKTLSTSPTGGVVKYEWDFGDGSPVDTTSGPVVSHNYATSGIKMVTLKVTNEAGTSTGQTYFGRMMYNNGSVKAQYSFQVTIEGDCDGSLLPPSNATIKQKYKNCRYRNTLTIFAPTSGPKPDSYLIYADAKRKSKATRVANTGNPVTVTIAAGCQSSCYYIFSKGANGVSCDYLQVGINSRDCN